MWELTCPSETGEVYLPSYCRFSETLKQLGTGYSNKGNTQL